MAKEKVVEKENEPVGDPGIPKKFELPMKVSKALHKSPKNMVIFSKPKIGKSSMLAQLPNWLLLDQLGPLN